MADMPGRFMLSASVHDTRSLLSINLLITFEGLSENSDNARKGKSLGAPANGARISQKKWTRVALDRGVGGIRGH